MKSSEPCARCPFRRNAPAGYIGGHDHPEEITDIAVRTDGRFPCHMEVNKQVEGGEKFDRAVWTAPVCSGAAALLNNMCKLSRQPEVARMQKQIGKRIDIFDRPEEMDAHHNAFKKRKARQ